MRKLIPQVLVVATVCLLVSCKDDKKGPVLEPARYGNYTPLKVGNYWIYQVFDVDSLGYGPPLNEYDSCYVSRDTVINGNTYYYLTDEGPFNIDYSIYKKWLRDSSHYLVDHEGNVYFSSEDYGNFISNDTIPAFRYQRIMTDKDAITHAPLGEFVTSNCQTFFMAIPGQGFSGTRTIQRKHAKNIGIVAETKPFYWADVRFKERRLVRYHLN